jgi:hypothetical protein
MKNPWYFVIFIRVAQVIAFFSDGSKIGLGRAMAEAVSRRPLTAEARVRSRVGLCGICGGLSGAGTSSFPRVLRVSSASFIPPVLHYMEKRKKTNCLHHGVAQ